MLQVNFGGVETSPQAKPEPRAEADPTFGRTTLVPGRRAGLTPLWPQKSRPPPHLRQSPIAAGANPKAVQTNLGHSSITVSMDRYTRLFASDIDHLIRRLGDNRARSPAAQPRPNDHSLASKSAADDESPREHRGFRPKERSWRWDSNPRPADYKSAALAI
jgi:hypothetical protein